MDQIFQSFSPRQLNFLAYQARCFAAGLRYIEEFEHQVKEELKLISPSPSDDAVSDVTRALICKFV